MTETSRFWNGTTIGDATAAPYEADTVFSDVLRALSRQVNAPNSGCVFNDYHAGQSLGVTNTASPVSVAPGTAMVWGTWYHSDAATTFAIPTPGVSTRVDRIVLRKDWIAQTVRLFKISGTEGAGIPALTQTPGVLWDFPLAQASITTGGVITLTDERRVTTAADGAAFYPWVDPVNPAPFLHPGAVAYVDGVTQIKTLPSSIPSAAMAVQVAVTLQGTVTAPGVVQLYSMSTGWAVPLLGVVAGVYVGQNIGTITIPMFPSTPLQFKVVEGGHSDNLTFTFDVIGWWMPII